MKWLRGWELKGGTFLSWLQRNSFPLTYKPIMAEALRISVDELESYGARECRPRTGYPKPDPLLLLLSKDDFLKLLEVELMEKTGG